MTVRGWAVALLCAQAGLLAQELNPAKLLKPGGESWPTYNGDYSGRRYSSLKQIDTGNVSSLASAWIYRASNYGAASFGSPMGFRHRSLPSLAFNETRLQSGVSKYSQSPHIATPR